MLLDAMRSSSNEEGGLPSSGVSSTQAKEKLLVNTDESALLSFLSNFDKTFLH